MAGRETGVVWPGWDVGAVIGRGGFGTVYKITKDVYGYMEEAALKVITIPHDDSEVDYLLCSGLDRDIITQTFQQKVKNIAREYQLMKQLGDNPNIVRCDDFRDIQHDDGLGWDIYIKMELLTPLLKAPKDLLGTEEQVVKFALDMCNALIACQRKDIIHRDIKPQNVFVAPNGSFKLGDFGIARTMDHTTQATAGIGTYGYMAPEVAKNEAYGKTADIYSLGLMLYWLLNERRLPFLSLTKKIHSAEETDLARVRRFAGDPIPEPKNGSAALKAIVLKACEFKPEDRYQSALEMQQALLALDKPVEQEAQEEQEELTVYGGGVTLDAAGEDRTVYVDVKKDRAEEERARQEKAEQELARAREEQEKQEREEKERIRREKEEQKRLRREKKEKAQEKSKGEQGKKKKVNWIAVACAVVFVAVVIVHGCYSVEKEVTWELSGGTLTISGEGPMHWSGDEAPWLESRKKISYVVIEEGITSIENRAFKECINLKGISIPSSVTKIGSGAFYSCEALTEIEIPDGVTYIGESAFMHCTKLTSITLPDNLQEVPRQMFYNCEELTRITIPEAVTKIGYGAFSGCDKLAIIVIPKSVKTIEEFALAQSDYSGSTLIICYAGIVEDWAQITIADNNGRIDSAAMNYNFKVKK